MIIKWEVQEYYYEKDVEEKVITNTMRISIPSSIILQALNNEQDRHLTINYYDYKKWDFRYRSF